MLMSAKQDNKKMKADERKSGKNTNASAFQCDSCGEGVGLITAERAATLCQCSRRKIYRWIEEGELHFKELVDGAVLVCGRTLAHKIEELNVTTNQLGGH